MNLQEITDTVVEVWEMNPKLAVHLEGPPGCGKTYVSTITIPQRLGIHHEAICMFRPSLRDPTDVGGLPMRSTITTFNEDGSENTEAVTDHLPIKAWVRLNEATRRHGRGLLVIDELNQSTPMMFNALNGIILDHHAGEFVLDPRISKIATGNRQQDKAASNRMPGHTSGRMMILEVESSLDGFIEHCHKMGWPLWLQAFLKFRPVYVNAYDPNKRSNPTERTWELLVTSVPETMPKHRYRSAAMGLVGETATGELMSFKDMWYTLPDPHKVLADPDNHPVPATKNLSQLYAIATALSHIVDRNTMAAFVKYTERMPKDFFIMAMSDAKRLHPEVTQTQAYRDWLLKHGSVLIGQGA
jgi:hypothetical protein